MSRSAGHCMVMGTASTMASMAEALGMALPGNAAIPAADSRRLALAEMAGPPRGRDGPGRRTQAVRRSSPRRPSTTPSARDMAIGGSTNAIIHLVALAGRVGVPLPLARFDELSRTTPFLLNVRPSGKYLMEDFFYAGGLPVVLQGAAAAAARRRADRERPARWPTTCATRRCYNADVIRPLAHAARARGRHWPSSPATSAPAARSSSSRPRHRICSPTAAAPWSSRTTPTCTRRIDDPALPIDETSVLVLKHVGPEGRAGHAGVGRRADAGARC